MDFGAVYDNSYLVVYAAVGIRNGNKLYLVAEGIFIRGVSKAVYQQDLQRRRYSDAVARFSEYYVDNTHTARIGAIAIASRCILLLAG